MAEEVILLVEASRCICCGCGGTASPDQITHTEAIGPNDKPEKGCGKKFTHLSTYWGDDFARLWRKKRRDLIYKGVGYYDKNEKFVLWVKAKYAIRGNWQGHPESP